jgi:hypothetical protein
MATIERYRVNWNGVSGPAVSTFYGQPGGSVSDLTPALKTFFSSLGPLCIPSGISISFNTQVDQIDEFTGMLTGTRNVPQQSGVTGAAGTAFSMPSGLLVQWITGAVHLGKRVVGRTFLVPAAGVEAAGGLPASGSRTAIAAAAATFVTSTSLSFGVWSRPFVPGIGSDHPAHAGQAFTVTGAAVPNKFVVLRSRRD